MYEQKINRATPGCILILLDRSDSMRVIAANGVSLAAGAAQAVNRLLFNIAKRSQKERGSLPRHYFDIGVFGYGAASNGRGEAVESAFQGALRGQPLVALPDLASNPMRIDEVRTSVDLPPSRMPIWVDPTHGSATPMCEALHDGRVLRSGVDQDPSHIVPTGDPQHLGRRGHRQPVRRSRTRGLGHARPARWDPRPQHAVLQHLPLGAIGVHEVLPVARRGTAAPGRVAVPDLERAAALRRHGCAEQGVPDQVGAGSRVQHGASTTSPSSSISARLSRRERTTGGDRRDVGAVDAEVGQP